MKNYLILLAFILLAGCASTKPSDEIIYTTGFDFSKYTEQGFLITPESYLGEYQSIGLISVTLWPAVIEEKSVTKEGRPSGSSWHIGELNVTKAIDEIYEQADNMGADAIINFSINSIERNNGILKVPGAEISGFAIKRE